METACKYSRHSYSLLVLLGTAGITLAALVVLSYTMDPFGLYHDKAPYSSSYSYVTKAKALVDKKPSKIIIGSSIVDDGFSLPGSIPLWTQVKPEERKPLIDNSDPAVLYYNLGIRGGGMKEVWEYLDFAYRNNPKLDSVIAGVEYDRLYTKNAGMPHITLLDNNGEKTFDFLMEYLISPLALQEAYKEVYQEYYSSKLIKYILLNPDSLSGLMNIKASSHAQQHENTFFHPSTARVIISEQEQEFNQFIVSVTSVHGFMHLLPQFRSALTEANHQEAMEYFDRIVSLCHEHNIRLQIYFSPQPALFWALLDRFGLSFTIEEWYKYLTRHADVWDFSESLDFRRGFDNDMIDRTHFKPKVGKVIWNAIVNHQEGIGHQVSAEQALDGLARRKTLLEQWKKENPEIAAAIAALPVDIMSDPQFSSIQELMPVLMEPEYKSYHVIKMLNCYFAVPSVNKPPYNGYKLIADKYSGTLKAANEKDILTAIDTSK